MEGVEEDGFGNFSLISTQIVELYAFGWDRVANTVMDDFLERQAGVKGRLGVLLLRVAAYRLHRYPKISSFLKQASYGAQLSDYLDKVVRYDGFLWLCFWSVWMDGHGG